MRRNNRNKTNNDQMTFFSTLRNAEKGIKHWCDLDMKKGTALRMKKKYV